jgi:hypothetical protein
MRDYEAPVRQLRLDFSRRPRTHESSRGCRERGRIRVPDAPFRATAMLRFKTDGFAYVCVMQPDAEWLFRQIGSLRVANYLRLIMPCSIPIPHIQIIHLPLSLGAASLQLNRNNFLSVPAAINPWDGLQSFVDSIEGLRQSSFFIRFEDVNVSARIRVVKEEG